jgi:hypothetical protein
VTPLEPAAPTDAQVRASASDLLLWMTNRLPLDAPGLGVRGDRAVPQTWEAITF